MMPVNEPRIEHHLVRAVPEQVCVVLPINPHVVGGAVGNSTDLSFAKIVQVGRHP